MPSCFPPRVLREIPELVQHRSTSLGLCFLIFMPQLGGGILGQEGGPAQQSWWHRTIYELDKKCGSAGTSLPQLECLHWAAVQPPLPLVSMFIHLFFARIPPFCVGQSVPAWKWRTMPHTIGYRSHRVKHVYLGTQSTQTASDSIF